MAPRVLALAVSGRGLVPPGAPVIHVDDEAFMRGRGAFESLRVYGGRPFRLAEHLDRLGASCARLGVELPARPELHELVTLALDEAGRAEAVLRVYATPGRGEGSVALAVVSELPPDLDELRARGIRAITVEFRPADLIGGVKSTSYALNMIAVDEARAHGADDAIFVAGDGTVLEGSTSNVWWRRDGMLYTPAVDGGILAGVTRGVLAEAAPGIGYEVVEGTYAVDDLASAGCSKALEQVGEPLSPEDQQGLQAALADEQQPQRAAEKIESILDKRALFVVEINPEMRVKVARGPSKAELVEGGWRVFLVKIRNASGTTAKLRAQSPQGEKVFSQGNQRGRANAARRRRRSDSGTLARYASC